MKTNLADSLRKFSEGRLEKGDEMRGNMPSSQSPTFVRMIVMEVVSDANSNSKSGDDIEKKKREWHGKGVTNMSYADVLPRNTIIAKRVGEEASPMFVFPFFPSHLALPCKPGECVWAMIEKPDASNVEMAFWVCRISEPHISDDVNHSHPARIFETSINPSSKDRFESGAQGVSSDEDAWHELRNGAVVKTGENLNVRSTSRENVILKGENEDVFERLISETEASKLVSYEAVPRFSKRPGDVVLEGSNNTLIVLGTDRKDELKKTNFFKDAGSIDIVAGRGQTQPTFGKEASTTSIKDATEDTEGPELKKELNKSPEALEVKEGNPDFKNDRSRVLISQRTSVDTNFGLKDYNEKFEVSDTSTGDAAIVLKTDKIRLIARSDIELVVTGFSSGTTPSKMPRKDQKDSTDDWSSIILKANGDIIIKPSNKGLIKLGGEGANLAVLCSKAIPTDVGGIVTVKGTPIVDTMGGSLGLGADASPATGQFASKVVFK